MSTTEPTTETSTTATSPMTTWLIERITFYDQVDPATITPDAALSELGLDSIYGLTLCGDFEDEYGVAIDPAVLAEYATLGELGDGLAQRAGTA